MPSRSDTLMNPEVPQALRLQAVLIGGVVVVQHRQVAYLLEDCHEALVSSVMAWEHDVSPVDRSQVLSSTAVRLTNWQKNLRGIGQDTSLPGSNKPSTGKRQARYEIIHHFLAWPYVRGSIAIAEFLTLLVIFLNRVDAITMRHMGASFDEMGPSAGPHFEFQFGELPLVRKITFDMVGTLAAIAALPDHSNTSQCPQPFICRPGSSAARGRARADARGASRV